MTKNNKCPFCNGDTQFWYNIDKYKIHGCKNCSTSFVANMPSKKELDDYYNGFNFCINNRNKYRIISNAYKKFYSSFNLPQNAKMLDIGGGGGFFSAAFEKFGFGQSTYIDLDAQACEYAKSLNISNVINGNVFDLKKIRNEKYDFIYCRHVIEHLPNPIPVIETAIDLLNKNGLFLLQFPNGICRELLASSKFRNERLEILLKSNNFSRFQAIKIIYSKKTGNDLYPPRHLWGITQKGIKSFLKKRDDITFTTQTRSIRDKIWSPYYVNTKDYTRLSMLLHAIISGGNHLICKIYKK